MINVPGVQLRLATDYDRGATQVERVQHQQLRMKLQSFPQLELVSGRYLVEHGRGAL